MASRDEVLVSALPLGSCRDRRKANYASLSKGLTRLQSRPPAESFSAGRLRRGDRTAKKACGLLWKRLPNPVYRSVGVRCYLRLGSQNSTADKISATPITSVVRTITLMSLGAVMAGPRCGRAGISKKIGRPDAYHKANPG